MSNDLCSFCAGWMKYFMEKKMDCEQAVKKNNNIAT